MVGKGLGREERCEILFLVKRMVVRIKVGLAWLTSALAYDGKSWSNGRQEKAWYTGEFGVRRSLGNAKV
jgi:hypothetical protein